MVSASTNSDRPNGFVLATGIVLLQTIVGFIHFAPAFRFGLVAAIANSFVYPYFFWRGKNWARIVVLIISGGYFVLLLIQLRHHDPIRTSRNAIECILGGFLLYWLNTACVRAYFHRAAGRGVI